DPGYPRYHYYSNKWDSLHGDLPVAGQVWEWNPWNAKAGTPYIITIFEVEPKLIIYYYRHAETGGLRWDSMDLRTWQMWYEDGRLIQHQQPPLFAHVSADKWK